jgi:hypothetical protein
MDFKKLYETDLKNPHAIAFNGVGKGLRWRDDGGNIRSQLPL